MALGNFHEFSSREFFVVTFGHIIFQIEREGGSCNKKDTYSVGRIHWAYMDPSLSFAANSASTPQFPDFRMRFCNLHVLVTTVFWVGYIRSVAKKTFRMEVQT